MTTKQILLAIGGSVLTIAGAVGLYFTLRPHQATIRANFNKATSKARSTYGRVADAAKNYGQKLVHTEASGPS